MQDRSQEDLKRMLMILGRIKKDELILKGKVKTIKFQTFLVLMNLNDWLNFLSYLLLEFFFNSLYSIRYVGKLRNRYFSKDS